MPLSFLFAVLLLLSIVGYQLGRNRAVATVDGKISRLHSVPSYYGFYVALWAGLPAFLITILWLVLQGSIVDALVMNSLPAAMTNVSAQELTLLRADVQNLAAGVGASRTPDPSMLNAAAYYLELRSIARWAMTGLAVVIALLALSAARTRIKPALRARNQVERTVNVFLILCSLVAIMTTIGIVMSLLFEALRFFGRVSLFDFLTGLQWSPQTAMRSDQTGAVGAFGAVPLFLGTMLIAVIAMLVAVPVGLMSAIYMSEYAPLRVRSTVKPLLEILAGIPTVVYGFFAALTMAPFIRDVGLALGLSVSSESALAAGLVMGIMIIPFVSSLADDVINAVPQSLRDGSYGLGATKSETIRQVILPAALPGVVGGVLLGFSRAIGETMIVVMAAGLSANLTINPLQAVTTVTVQIASLIKGDQEFDSPKTLSVFGLGLVLFFVTLCLNLVALRVVQKYREKYD
ncbi:MAG: phosphate ABC transporter permease subunit PstC [Azospirillaceae bacterium]|nr:phosphate ABC transporter permease subunit PstC [Azospirillaceae bacterium]